jgi:hypothetical protein
MTDPITEDELLRFLGKATLEEQQAFRPFIALCISNAELIQGYDRLAKTDICTPLTPIERMVDNATGKTAADLLGFMRFCLDIWHRVPTEEREVDGHSDE